MAFNSYEFSFNGESSLMYGLMIYDYDGNGQGNVSFGNQAAIVETRTNNRIQPLHFGVNYHQKPLEFKLVFGAENPLDRYDLQNISMWLTGHQQYQWLSIDQPDLEHVQFRCLITKLPPSSALTIFSSVVPNAGRKEIYGLKYSRTEPLLRNRILVSPLIV